MPVTAQFAARPAPDSCRVPLFYERHTRGPCAALNACRPGNALDYTGLKRRGMHVRVSVHISQAAAAAESGHRLSLVLSVNRTQEFIAISSISASFPQLPWQPENVH